MKRIYLALFIALTVSACAVDTNDFGNNNIKSGQASIANSNAPISENISTVKDNRKLIKKGEVEFQTNNIEATRNKVLAAIEKYDAYLSSDNESQRGENKYNTLIIRVPAKSFDPFLNEATQGISHFDNKTIKVEDVTASYIDVEARIKTKKELENRYIDILKQAKDINEILAIEKELSNIRAEIESAQGQLKYLQDKIAYSTLKIEFYRYEPQTESRNNFGQKFVEGLKNGGENIIWFFIGLANIWPFILIALVIFFTIKYFRSKKRKKKLSNQ